MAVKTIDLDNPNPEPIRKLSHGGDLEWAVWGGHEGHTVASALPRRIRPHGVSLEEWERRQNEK